MIAAAGFLRRKNVVSTITTWSHQAGNGHPRVETGFLIEPSDNGPDPRLGSWDWL